MGGPHHQGAERLEGAGGTIAQIAQLDTRVAKIEGAHDGMKHGQIGVLTVGGIMAAVAFGVLAFQIFSFQKLDGLDTKIDAGVREVRAEIREEFRAFRTEIAAQTNAIANLIVSVRQAPPSMIYMPAAPQQIPAAPVQQEAPAKP
jgi:hypothetical protein